MIDLSPRELAVRFTDENCCETPLAFPEAGQAARPDDAPEEVTEAGLPAPLHHDPDIASFLAAMRLELPPFWIHLPREQMLGYGGLDDEWVPMCGPLRVEALTRDGSGRNWSRRIRSLDRDGCLRRETIPEADIREKPRSVCAQLISAGLAIEGNRNDIIDLIRRWPVEARILSVSRPGWMAGSGAASAYLLPDGKLLPEDTQRGDPEQRQIEIFGQQSRDLVAQHGLVPFAQFRQLVVSDAAGPAFCLVEMAEPDHRHVFQPHHGGRQHPAMPGDQLAIVGHHAGHGPAELGHAGGDPRHLIGAVDLGIAGIGA